MAAKKPRKAPPVVVRPDEVIAGLLAEARRTEEGSSHGARVSAWGLLGKHLGMFRERIELTGKDGGPIETRAKVNLGRLSDAELDALERIAARLAGEVAEAKPGA